MSDRHLDANSGQERRRYGNKEFGRPPGSSCPQRGLGRRAWAWPLAALRRTARRRAWLGLLAVGCVAVCAPRLSAATPDAASKAAAATNAAHRFDIRTYVIKRDPLIFSNAPAATLANYTGTDLGLERIAQAATELLLEYKQQGYPKVNISIAQELITNGIVTMHVFQGAAPQVLISGRPCFSPGDAGAAALLAAAAPPAAPPKVAIKTNAPPRFSVLAYEIRGDTLLATSTLMSIFAKRTGTNVALSDITQAASDLQMEYRNRGYPTVNVTIPPQQITNGIVKIRVFQGRISEILVAQNRYFSSNNVMRALPSLRTNIILNGALFQAELDRANANQDRQIYPELEPGLQENTTALQLRVKDRLPLHAKVDFNNQSSPGTPELRVNSSASYQNLWQLEHSVGVQYSFSPESYKAGDQWDFYDRPLVANYGGFYRLPLAGPESVAETVSAHPDNFGYDEATRKFRLPASSGRPELNFYASRSSIDTGLTTVLSESVNHTATNSVDRQDVQQDIPINSTLGTRLSIPLTTSARFQSGFSGGFDYKQYELTSNKTNIFTLTALQLDTISDPGHVITNVIVSTIPSPVPTTRRALGYLPLSFRYDANLRDPWGVSTFGLGLSANAWYSDTRANLQSITGSAESSGHWVILNPSMSRDIFIHTNWVTSLHAEGQWASQPLISNEQYGLGGLNTVRGYQEGEVFGDTGWWVGIEQKTPPKLVGMVYRNHPITVRASAYMEYGEVYLLDPQGRPDRTALWGTGFGGVASVGATWEARLLFSWPLLTAGTTHAGVPRVNFSLSAQF